LTIPEGQVSSVAVAVAVAVALAVAVAVEVGSSDGLAGRVDTTTLVTCVVLAPGAPCRPHANIATDTATTTRARRYGNIERQSRRYLGDGGGPSKIP
jgi:hypothetical protein